MVSTFVADGEVVGKELMMDERAGQRLRQELAKCRQAKGFRVYPRALRDEAAGYARERRAEGASSAAVGRELGVANTTVDAWAQEPGSTATAVSPTARGRKNDKLSLVPVVVRPEPVHRVLPRLEVEFEDGTRLRATGVAPEDLARALELLRGPA